MRLGEARKILPARKRKSNYVRAEERVRWFFLDSGAHSLYNIHVGHHGSITEDMKEKMSKMTAMGRFHTRKEHPEIFRARRNNAYEFYDSKEFYDYVDTYCQFIHDYHYAIDAYATVDVLFNPALSWKITKYIEKEWGLNPVPVIHFNTDIRWVHKHLDAGYDYIGIGGLGQEITKANYIAWADKVFNVICNQSSRKPLVKIHGFAMTAHILLVRYPWFSVDSASWTKAGGFGRLYIPRQSRGHFDFLSPPYTLNCSVGSPTKHRMGRNYSTLKPGEKRVVRKWVEEYCGQKMGTCDADGKEIERGVINHHGARKRCNLIFYEMMLNQLPDWPWPFHVQAEKRIGLGLPR